ncbi:MAG: polyketide cyclase / dehydrase and lipid transport [Mycobacterium sp.]|nr:polyketide cyclase / dehydrase and lipid transport [Mycobacterium sp.]MCX6479308.1 polyketide cyclase / dehydrase and lipid transport [Mycobacterium sp.]
MPGIQVADETFIAADPAAVGAAVGDRSAWRRWFADLMLEVVEDRTDKGVRWTVGGPLTGTMEIWLQPMLDGVVLHYFLHAEPTAAAGRKPAKPTLASINHQRRVAGKRMAFEIKNTLEATRPVGVAPGI